MPHASSTETGYMLKILKAGNTVTDWFTTPVDGIVYV